MATFIEVLIFIAICIIIFTIYWYLTIPTNLPPGPIGLPLFGSSLDFLESSTQHLKLKEYVKKYGPLFKLYIANKLVIILGDYDTIQEGLVKQGDVFAGRSQLHGFMPERYLHRGLVFSEGDLWKEQRRFALSTLRDFGVGRPILEPRIKEEVEYLLDRIEEYAKTGDSFNPQRPLLFAVTNVVSFLIFGRRFDYDDDEFVHHFLALSKRLSGSGVGSLSPFIISDKLANLFQNLAFVKKLKQESEDFLEYTERQAKETMVTFDPESEPSNYVHAFMKAAAANQGDSFHDPAQLSATALDLFAAGAETTSTTLRWAILYLAHNEEIQEKMHKEIKDQVGLHTLPNYGEKTKLPLTEAVIMETQRVSSLVPLGVSRRTLASTKLLGYDIPKDATVFPLLFNVMHNEEMYPNPSKFDPMRFLDKNGKVIRDPKVIPFQAGKRVCLGEPLARMELFLFLVGLVSRFRFYFPNMEQKPTLDPVIGMICMPVAYKVCVEARNE